MDLIEAMQQRHSVRSYENRMLDPKAASALLMEIGVCNKEGGLHIQLVQNEPRAFAGQKGFSGVTNYIAMIGAKDIDLKEKCGYYGERLVLLAQTLGLNTCWVTKTYKKIPNAFSMRAGEKLIAVIAVGYGTTQGVPHKSKRIEDVASASDEGLDCDLREAPEWFFAGVEAALLAPTSMNQQKFSFGYIGLDSEEESKVIDGASFGFNTKIDLGIAKYHFELGSGKGPEIFAFSELD